MSHNTSCYSGGGELLRAIRKQRGISIVQLSSNLGVSQAYLSKLERSLVKPTKEQLEVIYSFLNREE